MGGVGGKFEPPGVVVNVKSLPQEERARAYVVLNDLRRERCLPLSDPTQRSAWSADNWDFVAMSKNVKEHFWQTFRANFGHNIDNFPGTLRAHRQNFSGIVFRHAFGHINRVLCV